MSVEDKLDKLIQEIRTDRKQSDKDRHENRMWIFWGFALATLSLAVANISTASMAVSAAATLAFLILGWREWFKAYRPKKRS